MNIDRWFHIIKLRLRSFFNRNQVEKELDEEIRYHIEQSIEEKIAKGMNADNAKYAAIREIGGVDQQKEKCRDTRRINLIENIMQDFRYGFRGLKRSPGFTFTVILSLTLGIGANTAIFQLLNSVRLKTLPVSNPQELAELKIPAKGGFGANETNNTIASNPLWEKIQDHQKAFTGVFAWGDQPLTIGSGASSRDANGLWLSGEAFQVLGVNASSGRLLSSADDRKGCGRLAVISHSFGQTQFGKTEDAIGKSIVVWDKSFTVIGVTSPEFYGLEVGKKFDIALPVCSRANWGDELERREYFWLQIVGRLKPGWTLEKTSEYFKSVSPGIFESTVPYGYDADALNNYRRFQLTAIPAGHGISYLRERYESSLWLLLSITGLVLLIACVNIANLSLARLRAREKELAVRISIGASRWRVMSQTLSESALLSFFGVFFGLLLAQLFSRMLISALSNDKRIIQLDLSFDFGMITFTSIICVLTCIIFGVLPAFSLSHIDPGKSMKCNEDSSHTWRKGVSLQKFFLVSQVSVTMVLLVGATLFNRSFFNLVTTDTGVRQKGVIFALTSFNKLNLTRDQFTTYQVKLLEQVRSIPNVESASTTTQMPFNGINWVLGIKPLVEEIKIVDLPQFTYINSDYFKTLDIPLLLGRDFNKFDTANSRKVLIVNETFVKQYLLNRSPLGAMIQTIAEPGFPETRYEIVGIVKDNKFTGLRINPHAVAYVPSLQHPRPRAWAIIIIHSSSPIADVTAQVRRKFDELSPEISTNFSSFETKVYDRLVVDRVMAWLSGAFGILAIILASIGLYGLISYLMVRRTKEIGIRIALGANRKSIIRMMLNEIFIILIIGLLSGTALSLFVTRSASTLLFGLSPYDIPTLIISAGLLVAVAIVACFIPAYRASKIDPLLSLRNE